ncbi:MAG: glycosyltransferase family 2 protein [Acidimicrobiia bacterium]|nr:glycosyltransferase family 2 protein [Acidimicrobiia bacterium]
MSPPSGYEKPTVHFSVVIPVYNGELTIAAAVSSVLQQTHLHEVIIVDDGSRDRTSEAVRSLDDPRVHFLKQPNAGPAAARNTGADVASGSHLIFLDADDQLLPNALSILADVHCQEYQLARSAALIDNGDLGLQTRYSIPSQFDYPRGSPLAGTFSIERRLFESIGGYDDEFRFGENSELLFRAQMYLRDAQLEQGFDQRPTMKKVAQTGRSKHHYSAYTLDAAVRMIEKHGDAMRDDPLILANHHAIASHLYRRGGRRRLSVRHAISAAKARPTSLRTWARIPLSFASPGRRRDRQES